VLDIFKGVGDALGKDVKAPDSLLNQLDAQETQAMLQVRVVPRSASERFTEGSVHGDKSKGRRSPKSSGPLAAPSGTPVALELTQVPTTGP
jgi:hypothetical protein